MTKLRSLALAIALALSSPAAAQNTFDASTQFSIPITGTVATATKIISGIAGKRIYVTALLLVPVATSVVTFTTGTGTNCATNTANVTGALTFATGQTVNFGDGHAAVAVLPAGADLCLTIGTAASPGSLAYSQW